MLSGHFNLFVSAFVDSQRLDNNPPDGQSSVPVGGSERCEPTDDIYI